MILNEIQKQEVADYVSRNTRFIETYHEIYDHLLTAFEEEAHNSFHINLATDIVNKDFGGVDKIRHEEQVNRMALYSSFSGTLKREMLNTFKFPAIVNNVANLILGMLFYFSNAASGMLVSFTVTGSVIMMLIPFALMIYKICVRDRGRAKPSISTYALQYTAIFGMNIAGCMFYLFVARDAIMTLEFSTQLAMMFGVYFFLSVYLRAFLKIYNRSLKLQLY